MSRGKAAKRNIYEAEEEEEEDAMDDQDDDKLAEVVAKCGAEKLQQRNRYHLQTTSRCLGKQ